MKTSIQIPDEVYRQTKLLADNFSAVVTQALKDYLKKAKIKKALQSFGSWESRENDGIQITNELRKDRTIKNADRSR
jgi:predicted CopG family antitoxin